MKIQKLVQNVKKCILFKIMNVLRLKWKFKIVKCTNKMVVSSVMINIFLIMISVYKIISKIVLFKIKKNV